MTTAKVLQLFDFGLTVGYVNSQFSFLPHGNIGFKQPRQFSTEVARYQTNDCKSVNNQGNYTLNMAHVSSQHVKEVKGLFCLPCGPLYCVSTTEQSNILIVKSEVQSIILAELEGTRCTEQKGGKNLCD